MAVMKNVKSVVISSKNVTVINMSISIPQHLEPDNNTKEIGKLWCPYCGKWQTFEVLPHIMSNYDRCTGCTISTEDYHIKATNKLWGFQSAIEKSKLRKKASTSKIKKGK